MSLGNLGENIENQKELNQELPTCPYCGNNGLKCPFCFKGWMVKRGFYRYKKRRFQRYQCKLCKRWLCKGVELHD